MLATLCSLLSNFSFAEEANVEENLTDQLNFYAVIEIEAAYLDSSDWGDNDSVSDVILATAEFGFEMAIIEDVSINMVTLYKEGDIDLDMHQGYLQLDNIAGESLSINLGKMYLPFGQLETNLVNDTLALELVSTDQSLGFRESAIAFNWENGNMNLGGYLFNGDIDEQDQLNDWGLSFSYAFENINLGIDYLNNITDSAMIAEALLEHEGIIPNSSLTAMAIHANAEFGAITLLVEYVQTDDLDGIGFQSSNSPSVAQIDLGYDFGNGWAAGAAIQLTDDGAVLGLPETRFTAGVGTSFYHERVSLSFEFWHDEDYDSANGGSGEAINGLVMQVASEF